MLQPVRSPLGAPGVFALPEVRPPSLHPQRMDVCGFVGVAPRGPARAPEVGAHWPAGWRMVTDAARPLQRSVPVAVRSFDEYVQHFGAFEGPGLLPQAVASYFEQGGRLAWIVRVVHDRVAPFHDGCARATLAGPFTQPLVFIARNEGTWGNRLSVALGLSTTSLAFTLDGTGQLLVDPRAPIQPGCTLRLSDADGHAVLSVCLGLHRVRDASHARERLRVELSVVSPNPPVRAEVVEATIAMADGAGLSERFDHLALVPDHQQSLASVLCERSGLVWPHPDWAGETLVPADPQVELLSGTLTAFAGGVDAWDTIVHDDFFDDRWSAAEETGGEGITAFAGVDSVTQIVVPDLYVPAQWAGTEFIAAVPASAAGADFGPCVGVAAIPAVASHPPSALANLILDPRTQAGLDDVIALQRRVQDFCEATQNHIALVDVPPGLSVARIEYWRAQFDTAWIAAYHPWLVPTRRRDELPGDVEARERRLPPSAVAAGIVACRELQRGIQHGPANEVAREVVHVAEAQPAGRADALHPINVNCFVREPQGIVLVAARTLSRDADWRQLSVRRLILMLRRALRLQMQWAVFEPNGPRLWLDMRHAIESLLRELFRAGAFAGRTEAESFFVRLHTEPARLDRGELLVEIGVAPAEPLEFILVRLRRDGDGTLNLEE
jgi:hypothetical protein